MHFKAYKTILSPKNNMNLYRGCTHGCIYCDSRSNCYQMQHNFEDVEVKENALMILEQQLKSRRKPCMISTGAMTDPYMPIENHLKLTGGSLELIEKYGYGISLLTKSVRILQDMACLQRINTQTKAVVQTTLTTRDDALARKIEPHVSTTSDRFAMLLEMKKVNIPTVVWISPILPFINDTEENLRGLLDYCIQAKVKGIMCFGFGVTMREGNRDYFYEQLDKHFPNMKEKYQRTFGNQYICNSPNHNKLMKIFKETCREHQIMSQPEDIFRYLNTFETGRAQLTLF